ncbi:hypothetical protein MAA44156_00697 [Mycobacterium avium subsp. avium]|nr:hypothetical protein MAA44156_00697 [Mycobacterium avium subsp. avium]
MTKKCDLRVLTVTSVTNVPKAHESEGRLDRLEVEGLFGDNSRGRNCKPRPKRKNVANAPHWQIDADGKLYYQRREVEPHGNPPIIDLGPSAYPPILPAYNEYDGGRERFVDELVCWHFHGPISPTLQLFTHVRHLDGDWLNCAADNLVRELDEEWREANKARQIAEWMMVDASRTAWELGVRGHGGEFSYAPSRQKAPRGLRDEPGIGTLPSWAPLSPVWASQDPNGAAP